MFEAAKTYDATKLKKLAFEFIIANYAKVSSAEAFDRMNKECFKEILNEVRQTKQAEMISYSALPLD